MSLCLLGLSCLLAASAAAKIEVEVVTKSTEMWNGEALPAYPAGQPEVTVLRITIPPRAKLPWHKHPVINAGVLLSGRLIVHAESGKTFELKAGEPLVELVDRWHYGENPGDEPAVILVFYAGIEGKPVSILKDVDGEPHSHGE